MQRWYCILVVTLVASLTASATAQVDLDAAAIADRYMAAMEHKDYAFLSKAELQRRRDVVAACAARYLHQPLDKAARSAILDGIDRCIDRLYSAPAGTVNRRNGFGSGGEEWMYLNDRDYFLTFQYHLWAALTHQPLAPADAARLQKQHDWMRQYLTAMPFRGVHEPLPRKGMTTDEVRPWALAELTKAFADPMDLLAEPMADEGFAKLQDRFKQFSNGIAADFHDMEVAALDSRFPSQQDHPGRDGYTYQGKLPFDDMVVDIWGNGPSLHFASNADFRGNNGTLSRSSVYDVVRCATKWDKSAPAPASPAMDAWLAREGRGDLTLDGTTLIAVRGAKIATAPVKDWFEADKLSDDELRTIIRKDGRDRISVKGLPAMNGPHRGDRSEGEFFIVVQTGDNHLAVINLYNYEFGLSFWSRPRTTKTQAAVAPATQP